MILQKLNEFQSKEKRKSQTMACDGENVEKSEHLYTVGGNVKWGSCCGKQYGRPTNN